MKLLVVVVAAFVFSTPQLAGQEPRPWGIAVFPFEIEPESSQQVQVLAERCRVDLERALRSGGATVVPRPLPPDYRGSFVPARYVVVGTRGSVESQLVAHLRLVSVETSDSLAGVRLFGALSIGRSCGDSTARVFLRALQRPN